MTQYTAQELVAAAKRYIAADAAIMSKRPAGVPRTAWRMENSVSVPIRFKAKDWGMPRLHVDDDNTIHRRRTRSVTLCFDLNGNPYDLWVWVRGRRSPKLIERIDLGSADADDRLCRYERVYP